MSDTSPRFALPWLQPGQAQKELFHNEALQILDAALHVTVEAVGATVPPGAPLAGQCWATGAAPGGAWAGQAHRLATWSEGGWRFLAPVPGMTIWVASAGVAARWSGGGWSVAPSIAAPAGGGVIDVQARAAIAAILAVLRADGLTAA